MVFEIAQRVSVPVIGCGGIMTGIDAVEYLLAGATAVQVGTATLVDPFSVPRIASELEAWLHRERIANPADIVGAANPSMMRVRLEGHVVADVGASTASP
jgi:dihydroorotate dehydrogenase (NAD+) catalytic subunit